MDLSHDNFDLVLDDFFGHFTLSEIRGHEGERTFTLHDVHPTTILQVMGRKRVQETMDRLDTESNCYWAKGWKDS